jgi:hypothetical protein
MKQMLSVLAAAAALLGLGAMPAAAQATRVFVSGFGDDGNPAACRRRAVRSSRRMTPSPPAARSSRSTPPATARSTSPSR